MNSVDVSDSSLVSQIFINMWIIRTKDLHLIKHIHSVLESNYTPQNSKREVTKYYLIEGSKLKLKFREN